MMSITRKGDKRMIAIFKREIKNYLKRPLFWVGILLVIYGVFNTTSPYLMTHYLGQGEKIVNDYPDTVRLGDVYEGYIPANPEKHREIWSGQIKQALIDELEMSDLEAQSVMSELVDMELEEAFVYLEEKYDWYSARYMYEDSAYYKGTSEEINAYLNEKMKNKTFSFYYSRKFADFAGLFMCFFATIMLAVLFLQDTKKHTYELLHTKPITAGKYVLGKVSAGFAICLIALTIINLLFWALCVIYTKDSGFEVRFWDFIVSTVLYILPNTQMGFVVIPGSKNAEHIKDNMDIFDFALTDEEMEQIAKLDKNERYYHRTDEQLVQFANWKPEFEK